MSSGCGGCGGQPASAPESGARIAWEVSGGQLALPQRYDTFEEAKAVASSAGAQVFTVRA